MEKIGINLGFLVVQILNFAIIFVVLRAWVYKPLLGMMEKRRLKIAEGLENARVAAEARANAETEAAKIITDAQQQAGEILRDATERAEAAQRDVKLAAEAEIVRLRQAAQTELEQERLRTLSDLRGQVVGLSVAAAQKLIGESLLKDKDQQKALLDEFFSGVKSGKVIIFQDSIGNGDSAIVTTALPLNENEKDVVQKELVEKIGDPSKIKYVVDPTILGGLIIKIGDRTIDGSVAGQLQMLKSNIK